MILFLIKLMWVSIVPTSPVGVATYIQETKLDGPIYNNRDGETKLYFSADEALYVHLGVSEKTKMEEGDDNSFIVIKGDEDGFPIHMDRVNGSVQVKASVSGEGAIVLESIPHIDWKIQPDDTRQIGKYTCRKAVGIFGGRVYDAWFTPEIPVPHGPYKLGGLPGLILEAHSRDGKVSFHFKSFEWVEQPDRPVAMPVVKFVFQSWKEYTEKVTEIQEKKVELARAKLAAMGATGTISYSVSEAPKGDFTIEKKNTP